MTRKFAIAALAAAALAAGPMSATEASARDGRRTNAAIGLAAGIGGALLGAALANAQPKAYGETRYEEVPRYRHQGHGFRAVSTYASDDEDCFQKPIRRFDPYYGRVVTVGTKEVCR